MKKLLITLSLVAAVSVSYGQGTFGFSNGGFYRISTGDVGSAPSTWVAANIAPNSFNYGVFYGLGQSTSLALLSGQLGVNSTTGAGLIANPLDGVSPMLTVTIPNSSSTEADVWMQVRGWSASFGTDWARAQDAAATTHGDYFGQTDVRNILPLIPSPGPGQVIWQLASGVSPNKFYAFTMYTAVVPEPSTMALTGLGVAAMLIFRRRK